MPSTIDQDNTFGFVDKRQGRGTTESPLANATEANYLDIAGLDTALNAFSSTTYPQATLDRMTKNDKIYAYRKVVDSAGMSR